MLQPGGAWQTPSSVVHTSPVAQLPVDAHGAPPAPPEPLPAAPPAPLPPLAPPEPPPPVGSSGHRITQTGRPEASGSQTKTVSPTAQAMAGVASTQFRPAIVPPAAAIPPPPPRPAAPPPEPPFPSGISGST